MVINYLLTTNTRKINDIREDHNIDAPTMERLVDLVRSAISLSGSKKERYTFYGGYQYVWKRGRLKMSKLDDD